MGGDVGGTLGGITPQGGSMTMGSNMGGSLGGRMPQGGSMGGSVGGHVGGNSQIGHTSTSCGAGSMIGQTPVDCTAQGDQNAACVYGDHCLCSEGYECDSDTPDPLNQECLPQSICVPISPERIGTIATSCGSPNQGLTPVDCTAQGDINAFCVFGNHCACSEGFVCEANTILPNSSECEPETICIPEP